MVLTSSQGSFPGLARALRERSFDVLERPLVQFLPPDDWSPLDDGLKNLRDFTAVALTSPRAATAMVERMRALGIEWPGSIEIWALGEATAGPLRPEIEQVRLAGADSAGSASAEKLAHAMLDAGVRGPVLFPAGDRRREELPLILRERGVRVHEVVCYRTRLAAKSTARASAAPGSLVVVASPSVVELLVEAIGPKDRPSLIAVGPTTAAAARVAGWPPAAVAAEPSTAGVIAAISGLLAETM